MAAQVQGMFRGGSVRLLGIAALICFVLELVPADAVTRLAQITKDVPTLKANQKELLKDYCPTKENAGKTCVEEPTATLDIALIGGLLFAMAVGIAVGTDTTVEGLVAVIRHSKRGFIVGMIAQFGFMPIYAMLCSLVFADDMKKTSYYSYEAAVLGIMLPGCVPGGTTSNLFTWFCGGNVPLSILMSLVSNIAALAMMPLTLYIYYELRFINAEDVPSVPYDSILIPLIATLACVFIGMVIKKKAGPETIWWVAKLSSLFAIVFLFLALLIGAARYPQIFTNMSWSMAWVALTIQPVGYIAGFYIAKLFRCSLKDRVTIAFETGIQNFTLGLVMVQLGFNAEKEVCQFDSLCMNLIDGTSTDKYKYAWSADGRIKEGDGKGMITLHGFLPGEAGDRTNGGCCRYNELIFQDAFKYCAVCAFMYAIHSLWMVIIFRKIFPRGFSRCKDIFTEETWEQTTSRERVVLPDGVLQPIYAPEGSASEKETPAITVMDLLKGAAARCSNEPAMAQEWPPPPFVKGQSFSLPWSQWQKLTWSEYVREIETTAKAFASLGLSQNGTVAIYGFNSPKWNISALAAMIPGGKCCGIYPTDTQEQVTYKVEHSNSCIMVVEDNKKLGVLKKALQDKSKLKCLKAAFMYGDTPDASEIPRDGAPLPVYAWDKIESIAAGASGITFPELNPGSPCCLVYTSGTTGMPKAVMLSHDNITFSARCFLKTVQSKVGVDYSQDRVLSYLPLSHVAGFLIDVILPITVTCCTKGYVTCYTARPYDLKEGTVKDRLVFVRPTIFLGVPRVWEKFHEGLKAAAEKVAQLKGMKARLPIFCCFRKTSAARWAKSQGLRTARALQYGGSGRSTGCMGLADGMILSKIRAALGLDAIKVCFTGAAPIMLETLEAFGSYDLHICELYGMSETSAYATCSTFETHLWNSCGFPAPGGQVRIFRYDANDPKKKIECPRAADIYSPTEEEQGEICFRGRHIMMGYLANPDFGEDHVREMKEKTAEAIDEDGWMRSGDMGCLGKNGFVRITGRYKELIITAGGENVAPVPIEDNIKKCCPAISNVIMIGDKRKYNTCLVTLKTNGETSEELTKEASLIAGVQTVSAASQSSEFRAKIQDAIEATNKDSKVCPSNASKVQKFEILPSDFTVDGEELTPTMKMRRKVIESKYADYIEAMYNGTNVAPAVTVGVKSEAKAENATL